MESCGLLNQVELKLVLIVLVEIFGAIGSIAGIERQSRCPKLLLDLHVYRTKVVEYTKSDVGIWHLLSRLISMMDRSPVGRIDAQKQRPAQDF
jgi:hypothetical protein